jgi:hypothetical protein
VDLRSLLADLAGFEKRAITLYRTYAERFADNPAVGRLWREMSDVEAGHFATLTLAGDLLDMPGSVASGTQAAPLAASDTTEALYQAAETAARGSPLLAAVVETALRLEEDELPRVRSLLTTLAGRARASVLTGVLPGFVSHLDCLETLATLSGRTDLTQRIRALKADADTLRAG